MASSPVAAEPFCITLANSPDWVAEVVNDWPGPIAHEYDRLRRLLQADQLVASVWQLKDVAEVLIRFPACVMARDILEHGSDRAFQVKTRGFLLGPAMSMGTWQTLAQTLAAHIVTHDGDGFFAPQVASLFWTKSHRPKGEGTALNSLFGELANWRNESFGHGAFRADLTEFEGELKDNLEPLHQELGHHRDAWQGLVLQRADGTPLTGAASIVPHAPDAEPAHAETSEPLALVRAGGGALVLAPYVQLRRCTVCDCRDVFLFDWRKTGDGGRDKYRFIDYRAGHGNPSLWSQEPLLDAETGKLGSVPAAGPGDDGAVDADYTSNDVNAMLAERATAARYRTPEYLRRRLEAFLREQEAGVWWLRAPGHTGKSTFVSGLDPRHIGDLGEARFAGELADLAVVAFYIRREYQTSPEQLADQLTEQLKAVLNVAAGARALPQLDPKAADPGPAMVAWLEAMRAAGGGRHRLLVCIDGLDELPPGTERSITDFIPAPDSLPEGLFFVVTSRPLGEMAPSLAARLPAQLRGAAELEVGLDDPEYRALLRAYFDDRLAKRREREALEKPDPPHDFDRLFDQVLARSDGRFLYLSYLADRLADLTLELDGLDELPSGEGLFKKLLNDIEGLHAGSPLRDLFQRILLHLAAAEAAFEADRQQQPAVAQEIWHGLPLELLARRVEGDSDGAVSLKLAYALYTLKPTLGSWKGGEGRHASFQLGLKGLAEVIGARWPDELRSLHARLAQGLIDRLKAPVDGTTDTATVLDADDSWTLAHVVAHLQLGGMGRTISEDDRRDLDSHLDARESQAVAKQHYREAVRWTTRQIWLQEASAIGSSEPDTANRVAGLLSYRGWLLYSAGDLAGAVKDCSRCVTILEGLQEPLGDRWSPDLAGQLVKALGSRADALRAKGDLAGALDDHNRAIGILEVLRAQQGDQMAPDRKEQLADALASRGSLLAYTDDISEALDDYRRALTIHQDLEEQLGDRVSLDRIYSLSGFLSRAGKVLAASGDLSAAAMWHTMAVQQLEGLREQLGQWSPDLVGRLSSTYSDRADTLRAAGDLAGAQADDGRAVGVMEGLREQLGDEWPIDPGLVEELARNYQSRGTAFGDSGDLVKALEDYSRSIAVLEGLREQVTEQWSPDLVSRLARSYLDRAHTLDATGDTVGALDDYGRATGILEGLRGQLGDLWSVDLARGLEEAYTCHGISLRDSGNLPAAIEDFGRVIDILEGQRVQLADQRTPWMVQWSLDLARGLAEAYSTRGISLGDSGNLPAGIEDFGRAIDILEDIRVQLADQRPPWMVDARARAHLNRGIARIGTGDRSGALQDFFAAVTYLDWLKDQQDWLPAYEEHLRVARDRAIDLMEEMREQFGDKMAPSLVEALAKWYTRRGIAIAQTGDLAGELQDFNRAVGALEWLQERLGDEMPPGSAHMLAIAYANRGEVLGDTGDVSAALDDYDRSIDIHEGLREGLRDQWSPDFAFKLARTLSDRGHLLANASDRSGARRDVGGAIAILERLKEQMGEHWLPAYAEGLRVAHETMAAVSSPTT